MDTAAAGEYEEELLEAEALLQDVLHDLHRIHHERPALPADVRAGTAVANLAMSEITGDYGRIIIHIDIEDELSRNGFEHITRLLRHLYVTKRSWHNGKVVHSANIDLDGCSAYQILPQFFLQFRQSYRANSI